VVLGIATRGRSSGASWALMITGGILAIAGVVLIWVRSRLEKGG
jgi:hypothetical protein